MNKLKNAKDIEILEVLKNDIKETGKPYSSLTNVKLSEKVNKSSLYVRDRILKLKKKGIIDTKLYQFDENNKFMSRIIYIKSDY